MLVAITEQSEKVVLHPTSSKKLLLKLRNERKFFCPQCKGPVQLKIGTIKIPHFAHKSNRECESLFSEGESEQHLLGKSHLYELFQFLGFHVELESFIRESSQRADIIVNNGARKYAVEYQCSPLPNNKFLQRNDGYNQMHIVPIWICATPNKPHPTVGITKFSLSEHLKQFILTSKNQRYLLTYNPYIKKFIYFSNLLHLKGNSFLGKILEIPLMSQRFPFFIPKKLSKDEFLQYYNAYHNMKDKFLTSRLLTSKKGVQDLFLRSIYELRLNITSIPVFIGVPMIGNEVLKLFSLEWQAGLFYYLQSNNIKVDSITRQDIIQYLQWTNLPTSQIGITIVENYCDLLKKLSVNHVNKVIDEEMLINLLYDQFLAFNNGN